MNFAETHAPRTSLSSYGWPRDKTEGFMAGALLVDSPRHACLDVVMSGSSWVLDIQDTSFARFIKDSLILLGANVEDTISSSTTHVMSGSLCLASEGDLAPLSPLLDAAIVAGVPVLHTSEVVMQLQKMLPFTTLLQAFHAHDMTSLVDTSMVNDYTHTTPTQTPRMTSSPCPPSSTSPLASYYYLSPGFVSNSTSFNTPPTSPAHAHIPGSALMSSHTPTCHTALKQPMPSPLAGIMSHNTSPHPVTRHAATSHTNKHPFLVVEDIMQNFKPLVKEFPPDTQAPLSKLSPAHTFPTVHYGGGFAISNCTMCTLDSYCGTHRDLNVPAYHLSPFFPVPGGSKQSEDPSPSQALRAPTPLPLSEASPSHAQPPAHLQQHITLHQYIHQHQSVAPIAAQDHTYSMKRGLSASAPIMQHFHDFVSQSDPIICLPVDTMTSPSSLRTPSSGKSQRRRYKEKRKKEGAGYCECCNARFDNYDQHIHSAQHLSYASNDTNYNKIDDLIDAIESRNSKYYASPATHHPFTLPPPFVQRPASRGGHVRRSVDLGRVSDSSAAQSLVSSSPVSSSFHPLPPPSSFFPVHTPSPSPSPSLFPPLVYAMPLPAVLAQLSIPQLPLVFPQDPPAQSLPFF
eukprot:TRINITY_DN8426_c0_g1_i2.p1 TRINITY_DN8426_c0_g1~~TRINITY_DN8426_c0_g1_i2.p1  ORF type:complete len:628 (-),score=112.47 TRINITY_DN8426_c0_g1_i2:65-1948(-)